MIFDSDSSLVCLLQVSLYPKANENQMVDSFTLLVI
jgi:hypothetical protein